MSDLVALLELALSSERSPADRLKSLRELAGLLHDEAAVFKLLDGARAEASTEVRRAMLEIAAGVDLTQLHDREKYLDAFAYFAGAEPESQLRLIAVARLAHLAAHDDTAQAILAETMAFDLAEDVQAAALAALARASRLLPATADLLAQFARRASIALRPVLLTAIDRLDRDAAQRTLASMLAPWDASPVSVLERLARFPSLLEDVSRTIAGYAQSETRNEPRTAAMNLLTAKKDTDPALFAAIFVLVEQFPDRGELLDVLRHKLDGHRELVPQLVALFQKARSTDLKLRILNVLADAELDDLWRAALRDSSPWVRHAAIDRCRRHVQRFAKDFAAAIPQESVSSLREAMVRAFAGGGRLPEDVQVFLADCAAKETDPRVEEALAVALTNVPMSDANRAPILRVYRRVLVDPMVDEDVRAAVIQRVRSFAFRHEPELVECLKALLERETSIERVEEYHDQLRNLEPDLPGLVPTLLKLFYRFLHHYPRDPLHKWTQEFRTLAESMEDVRAQIGYIAKLTGATWMLDKADTQFRKANLFGAVLEAIRAGAHHGPQRLLDEAWETRTLRKSDLVALFNRLISCPGQDAILQHVFKIMEKAKLVSPEILDRCFAFLSEPSSISTYEVRKFLETMGKEELGYRERLVALFTQANFTHWCLTSGTPQDGKERAKNWHDWEWQSWHPMYPGWPVAELYFELNPRPEMRALLAAEPETGVPSTATIHYLLLHHWWRDELKEEEDYRAVGTLMRRTAGKKEHAAVHDRALCVFTRRWNSYVEHTLRAKLPARDVAEMAAEAYVGLCKMHAKYREKPEETLPPALKSIDVDHLEKIWPFGSGSWAEAAEHCRTATGEEEERAQELYRELAEATNDARREQALAALDALLTGFKHTKFVKSRIRALKATKEKLATTTTLPTKNDEDAAKKLAAAAESSGSKEEALARLDELFEKYSHTETVQGRVKFLQGWREKLQKLLGRK